jgi:hypothetical protein
MNTLVEERKKRQAMAVELLNQGKTFRFTADKTGLSRFAVARYAAKLGITRPMGRPRKETK